MEREPEQTQTQAQNTKSFRNTHSMEYSSTNEWPPVSQSRADALIDWLREYALKNVDSQLMDDRRTISPHVILDMGNKGLMGMQGLTQDGGLALSNSDMLRVLQQLGAIDLTLATFVAGCNLAIRPIQLYAPHVLREELMPFLTQGRELAAIAISEPGAGSNLNALATKAVPDGYNRWRLYGTKQWISSAAWAGVINIFAQVFDASGNPLGVTGFVIRRDAAGLRFGTESRTMGLRGMVQNTLYLEDVSVCAETMLGSVGAGLHIAQEGAMFARLCLGSMSVGGMKRCIQLMHRYATSRSITTGRLIDNPVTLVHLSELTAAATALEVLVNRTALFLDKGEVLPQEFYLVCKVLGSEWLWHATDRLIQMLGACGYDESYPTAQALRDARAFRILEGPTETLTMSLGSLVWHKRDELQAFIITSLGCPTACVHLNEAVDQIRELNLTFADRSTALYWRYMAAGEVACYALLFAATYSLADSSSSEMRRAATWAEQQLESAITRALTLTPPPSVLLDAAQMTTLVSRYASEIGDVDLPFIDEQATVPPPATPTRQSTVAEVHRTASPPSPLPLDLPNKCIHHLFEDQVERTPNALAIDSETEYLTYQELNQRANQLAHFLRELDIGPEMLVGIQVERSPNMIVAMLGVLKAGGAYVPLDPSYPQERLAFMRSDAQIQTILTQERFVDDIPSDIQVVSRPSRRLCSKSGANK